LPFLVKIPQRFLVLFSGWAGTKISSKGGYEGRSLDADPAPLCRDKSLRDSSPCDCGAGPPHPGGSSRFALRLIVGSTLQIAEVAQGATEGGIGRANDQRMGGGFDAPGGGGEGQADDEQGGTQDRGEKAHGPHNCGIHRHVPAVISRSRQGPQSYGQGEAGSYNSSFHDLKLAPAMQNLQPGEHPKKSWKI
jgi:hypothetical protein